MAFNLKKAIFELIEKAKSKQTIAELVSVLKSLKNVKVNLFKIVTEILTAVFKNDEDFTNINFEEKRASSIQINIIVIPNYLRSM